MDQEGKSVRGAKCSMLCSRGCRCVRTCLNAQYEHGDRICTRLQNPPSLTSARKRRGLLRCWPDLLSLLFFARKLALAPTHTVFTSLQYVHTRCTPEALTRHRPHTSSTMADVKAVPDLVLLERIEEDAIRDCLKHRHATNDIYTVRTTTMSYPVVHLDLACKKVAELVFFDTR